MTFGIIATVASSSARRTVVAAWQVAVGIPALSAGAVVGCLHTAGDRHSSGSVSATPVADTHLEPA